MFTVIEFGVAIILCAVLVTQVIAPTFAGQRVFPLLRRRGRAERELESIRDEAAAIAVEGVVAAKKKLLDESKERK